MLQSHGEGKHDHDPFHADAQEARVLKVQVNGANQHASAQEPSENVTGQQDQ
jgi:hypothetical protein